MIASQATSPLLEILGLSIKLPAGAERTLAVDNTSLMVMPGQTLCIVGESGSGKSMIANATMGLLASPSVVPVAGKIMFDGIDLLQLDDQAMRALRGRRIGMIFQEQDQAQQRPFIATKPTPEHFCHVNSMRGSTIV